MNQQNDKTALFETMPIPKAVFTLAVPTVLSCLVMVLYSLADTWFVGMLNDPVETAAVTLAAPILLAFNAINNLFGIGSSSRMSREMGLHDDEGVRKSASFGFWCALICGLLFSAAALAFRPQLLNLLGASDDNRAATSSYLFWTVCCGAVPAILNVVMAYMVRAEGAAFHAGVGTMSGCLLNILLDPIFILPRGLNMGAAGAGLATLISNCVACLYFIVLVTVRRGRTFISLNPKHFRPDRAMVKDILGVGVPASIQNLLNVTGMTILNNAVAVYGSEAVSAMGISHKAAMVPMYVALGIAQGVMPLVGYNYASRNAKRMKKAVMVTFWTNIIILVIFTGLYLGFAESIIAFFMSNDAIIGYGAAFIRAFALAQPFLAIDFLVVHVFQACGMGSRALLFAVLRKVVLEIPAIYILNYFYPLYGLAYAQLCAEVVLAIAAVIFLRVIFKKVDAMQQA